MTDQSTGGNWKLKSGSWSMERGGTEFRLNATDMEFPVAPVMTPADLIQAMHMRTAPDGSGPAFPPEFDFSPIDGAPLQPAREGDAIWVPPSGARPANAPLAALAVGLKKTEQKIDISLLQRRGADSDPSLEMPLPPPGAYEFFCAPFGTLASVLIAIDTSKGALFTWLPGSETWEPLSGDGALLSESNIMHRAWRAELMQQTNCCLFLPTDTGLAMVMPDFPSLKYRVGYIGDGPAKASPIAFEGKIWAPVADRYGIVQIVNVDSDGNEGTALVLENVRDLGMVSRPIAYQRMAVWPCEKGQIRLQVAPDGNVHATFIPWGTGITPHFEFGAPYLSRAGVLWQLCFCNVDETYMYVRLGMTNPEQVAALTPRTCSGSVNYRFRAMQLGDPWIEPEHGDDGAANTVVYPLLEVAGGGVLALRMASTSGLTELLNSPDRMRSELIFEDRSNDFVIQAIPVPRPWEMRLFFYQGTLWAYHPAMQRIIGWEVQP